MFNHLGLMSLGWGEWVVIFLLILLLFGAKRLPELARNISRSLRQVQRGFEDVKEEIEKENKNLDRERDRDRDRDIERD